VIAGLLTALAIQAAHADDSVAGLMHDRARLDAVQHGCKVDATWATPELCKTAAEAIRRRFLGQGAPYTLRSVDVSPNHPAPKPR
jgi:hypothetical protein